MPAVTKYRPVWEPAGEIPPTREGILRAILDITERDCTPAELLQDRSSTGYLKMARRMVDQFVQGASRFVIQGDFDCDGITSSVIWAKHLAKLAPTEVTIPNRPLGHATLQPLINTMKRERASHLVILDNGTNLWKALIPHLDPSHKVLILDHHQLSGEMPDDERITLINPCCLPGKKPENDLATAGLSYFLLPESDEKSLILAGLGQIGDVMPLTPLSHQIARATLQRLQANVPPSLQRLIPQDISMQSLSFGPIPRINAVSRMSHPLLAYHTLASDSPDPGMFDEMERLNRERIKTTEGFLERARAQLNDDGVQVIYIPEMPAGIAGLIASRMCEEVNKPVLALSNKDSYLSGSFRSPVDLDLSKIIQDMKQQNLVFGGGGHKRAGGLSLNIGKLPAVRTYLSAIKVVVSKKYLVTPAVHFSQLTGYYRELEPFGSGSRPPCWGIPYLSFSSRALVARESGRHWANKGFLETPIGRIPFLDALKVEWKPCGIAIGQISWDAYDRGYVFKMEDVL